MVKFSILIPTRNRLEYLRYAVSTVLRQNYECWEIIVSDNDSIDDVQGYVVSLGDCRVKYVRTKSFVSVTESWNHALAHSTGDYIIMLGDDDGLRQGYLQTVSALLQQHAYPDLLYSSALLYAYPGLFADSGQLSEWGNAVFFIGKKTPYMLDKKDALRFVKQSLNFTLVFTYNMQFSVIHRSLVHRLEAGGPFFQSSYPDYYATTALFLNAQRILVVPQNLAIVGICPKSFGWHFFTNKEAQGIPLLNNSLCDSKVEAHVKKYLIPGTNMNTSWLMANEAVRQNFGKELRLKVGYKKYRCVQLLSFLANFSGGNISLGKVLRLYKHLKLYEMLYFSPLLCYAVLIKKLFPKKIASFHRRISRVSHPPLPIQPVKGNFTSVLDVFEQMPVVSIPEV